MRRVNSLVIHPYDATISSVLEANRFGIVPAPQERPMVFARSPFFRILYLLNLLVFAMLAMPADGAVNLYRWPWTGFYQCALGLSMLTALLCFVFGRAGRIIDFSGFSPAIFLLLAAFASSCFLAEFSDRVALNLIVPVSALCLGYITHCLARNSDRPEKLALILFQGMGVIAFLLYFRSLSLWVATTFWGPESEIISSVNALIGYSIKSVSLQNTPNNHPFGHPNYTAGFSLLTLPLVVSLSLASGGLKRWIWGVVSILGLVVLLSSGSRAGTGGATAALLGGAIIFLKGKAKTRRRSYWFFPNPDCEPPSGILSAEEALKLAIIRA